MDQNTQEWHRFRKGGLGGSDAPVVMGLSPYRTRYQLWEEKLGLIDTDQGSYVTDLGQKFEPRARAHFCLQTGMEIKPHVMQHPEFAWLRVSLDGYNEKDRVFAEIKMMGKKNFDLVTESKQPLPEHWPQLQHQFLVTGFQRAYYITYTLNEERSDIDQIQMLTVLPDQKYMKALFEEEKKFWDLVNEQTPPELSKKDIYLVKDQKVQELASDYIRLAQEIKAKQSQLEALATELKALGHTKAQLQIGELVMIKTIVRKGNVDYKSIPELKSVDVEKYRGKPVTFRQIVPVNKL
jgi:putative phage-type endonuclease